MPCQPCGCDPEAQYECERHEAIRIVRENEATLYENSRDKTLDALVQRDTADLIQKVDENTRKIKADLDKHGANFECKPIRSNTYVPPTKSSVDYITNLGAPNENPKFMRSLEEANKEISKSMESMGLKDIPLGPKPIRQFETGATRDTDEGKYDYEAFLSPLVLERYAQYMHKHRFQADGSIRSGDNWQHGIPFDVYMKSGWRHFVDWWRMHRGPDKQHGDLYGDRLEDTLCALMFNVMGYLHESLKIAIKKAP